MEQSISMIATDSTCQFCFFKMVRLRQLDPQWSTLTEKGLGSFLYSLYSIGLLSGILVTYQNQLPRFRMFQKKQPMNKISQRLFRQFRDINTSYSVIWIYLRAWLVNAGVRNQSRTHSLCARPLANNSYRFVVITFYPSLSFKLRCRLQVLIAGFVWLTAARGIEDRCREIVIFGTLDWSWWYTN